jgi:integrase
MRIPNYLYLAPSGIWHFRLRVPQDLVEKIGRDAFKKSLQTRELLSAQRYALEWASQYAQAFAVARGQGMARDSKPTLDEVVAGAQVGRRYELELPNGVKLKTDGTQAEHDRAMEALDRIGVLSKEPALRAMTAPQPTPSTPSVPPLAIGKAVTQWLLAIKAETIPKTLSIKSTAVNGFASYYGEKKLLGEVGRVDVGQWVEALRISGLSTPTLTNKCYYLKGFFAWAYARGLYPSKDNPAEGQVIYRTREKRARRTLGFKAFTAEQIASLYSEEHFTKLSEAARWGAVIGLYTGARVAEVGQLALADFVEVEGIPCISITNEGLGQSVKNDASVRTIPLHPDLIRLGLLNRVEALRKAGEKRLFPKVKLNGVNGAGNWLSKAFSRHIIECQVSTEKGKHGFHSLRKTVVQGLQTKGVTSEVRAAYVGHELDDEHHATYSRAPTPKELLDAVSKLDWAIDLKALSASLT